MEILRDCHSIMIGGVPMGEFVVKKVVFWSWCLCCLVYRIDCTVHRLMPRVLRRWQMSPLPRPYPIDDMDRRNRY